MDLTEQSKLLLTIRLFGKFSMNGSSGELQYPLRGKPLELFCYLLLQRERIHSREVLASLFWGDCTTSRSKKYLRQALWQIQAMTPEESGARPILVADRQSVKINLGIGVWLDVAAFETACLQLRTLPNQSTTESGAEILKSASQLYQGDLLEGWYQDWCLFERERLRNMYLLMLEKLMVHCEERKQFEAGLEFGEKILQLDCAHERAYQTMMRLQYRTGDRAGAIRLYQRCVLALRKELGVAPSHLTAQILEQIRSDSDATALREEMRKADPSVFDSVVTQLRQVVSVLNEAQSLIENHLRPTGTGGKHGSLNASKARLKSLIKTPQHRAS